MALRSGNREQGTFLPPTVEDYVLEDAPVRAYDALIDSMPLEEMGFDLNSSRVGNPRYNPVAMLKLLVYGYSYGVRSSRKLERECNYNLSFIWLMGGMKPDFKTIAEFRRNNKKALKLVLQQTARLCINLGIIDGNIIFVDGTKIRANASVEKFFTNEKCEKIILKLDKRIDEIISEAEKIDNNESNFPSLVSVGAELKDKKKFRSKVKNMLKKMNDEGTEKLSHVDADCARFKSRQGFHAGYNVQSAVDEKHGLIVSSDAVSQNNDYGLLSSQIENANETLEENCSCACADSGYADSGDLKKVENLNPKNKTKVVVPSQKQKNDERVIGKKAADEKMNFSKQCFKFNEKENTYTCPEGHILKCKSNRVKRASKEYRIEKAETCRNCKHFGVCTTGKNGRTVERFNNEKEKKYFEAEYKKEDSQKIYRLRKMKAELPFGHIKRNLGVTGFLMRGLDGVNAETSILSTCFNISRMLTIFGGAKGLKDAILAKARP